MEPGGVDGGGGMERHGLEDGEGVVAQAVELEDADDLRPDHHGNRQDPGGAGC